ncbi:MAG: tetratricopeptide repeat protein [Saprospiraceae bacterium]|uniref:Tetratricopeptide repeat protein n=1 Tax=Candidatus Opimibacter skivensis TaxID=2982028 RepID=A0A9D7SQV3_9BACT|nr:tetratricopeptide repeat protein [Candidatus Opimibacter skivensis]
MDFQKEVLDKSYTTPVLVDFWAPWCGPCRVLTPLLEQIAEEQKDRWSLVKINTEDEESLARDYHIVSIPNVKLFYRGEVVQEFLGALSRQMILDWLKKVLPGSGLIALDQFLEKNEQPTTADLEKLLLLHPDSKEIAFVLSQIYLWDNPSRALELVADIKYGSPFFDKSNHIRDIGNFLIASTDDERLQHIKSLLQASEIEPALQQMIDILQKNNKAGDGLVSKIAIGIFNLLGTQHPFTKKYRKQLDMALWV